MSNSKYMEKHRLRKEIQKKLPDFAKMCNDDSTDNVLMHQDAFAASYQDEEYVLLGKAIKYAGLYKKEVRIIV